MKNTIRLSPPHLPALHPLFSLFLMSICGDTVTAEACSITRNAWNIIIYKNAIRLLPPHTPSLLPFFPFY